MRFVSFALFIAMKWTEERDEELKLLMSEGKRHAEIASIMNASHRSISNRCSRLGLRTEFKKAFICLNCKSEFYDLISHERKFCSSECSGSFNTRGRTHKEDTKIKIGRSLAGRVKSLEERVRMSGKNNPMWIDGRSLITKTKKTTFKETNGALQIKETKRKCIYCHQFSIVKKYKTICDTCRATYYKAYRPSCEFKFNIQHFKDEFDFELIQQYGRYSPSNKGNNLNGVSRDHMYSVKDGFVNKVDPTLIAHPANCRLMKHCDNSSKHSLSVITLAELMERIEKWNQKYGGVVRET